MKGQLKGIVVTRRASSLYQDRRGQTTILFALTVMIFVCFLAFMVNVGQLIHGRILTQAVADMVALSAANVQAAGLNEIADLNNEHRSMQDELLRWLSTTWFFSNSGEVNRLCDYFEDLMSRVINYKRNVNNTFPAYARNAAYRTLAWCNGEYGGFAIKELKLSGNSGTLVNLTSTVSKTLRGWYVQQCSCKYCPPLTTYQVNKNRYFPVQITGMKCGVPVVQSRYLYETYEKKTFGTKVYTVVTVTREEMGSLVNMASLGFDVKIPRMEAMSAAMPTGGNIEAGQPTYFSRFVPLEAFGYGVYRH
jgi:hypothetical protein